MGRPSKHNVDPNPEKRTHDGTVYDSVMEMRFYVEWLTPKVESGEMLKCEKQVPFVLQDAFEYNGKHIREIVYVADFVCTYSNGQTLVIDTKGFPDAVCLQKRKMFWFRYPDVEYIWMTYSACDGGWVLFEELKKLRKKRKEEKVKNEVKDISEIKYHSETKSRLPMTCSCFSHVHFFYKTLKPFPPTTEFWLLPPICHRNRYLSCRQRSQPPAEAALQRHRQPLQGCRRTG
jgi:hypothetical protein